MKFPTILVSGVIGFYVVKLITENWAFLTSVFRGTIWLVAAVLVTSLILGALLAFDTLKRRRAVNQSADDADIATNNQVQAEATQQATLANERELLASAWAGFELNQAQLELQLRVLMAAVGIEQARNGQSVITDIGGLFEGPRPSAKTINNLLGDGNGSDDAVPRLQTLVPDLMRFKTGDAPQIRLVAQSGAGKSTLLHHFVDEVQAKIVLFQTHVHIYPEDYAQYGDRLHVIGIPSTGGVGLGEVEAKACDCIERVAAMVGKRYLKGTRSPMLLIIDEWLDICIWAKNNGREAAIEALKILSASQARKVGVGIVLATQSANAGNQGFKGSADILKNMTTVELYKAGRYAKVTKAGAEPLLYDLPGVHPIPIRQEQRQDAMEANTPYLSLADELAEAEKEIRAQQEIPIAFAEAFDSDLKAIESKVAKHSPENVNRIIDEILADDPDVFPTKSQVTQAVGITGGSKYAEIIRIYDMRLAEWDAE